MGRSPAAKKYDKLRQLKKTKLKKKVKKATVVSKSTEKETIANTELPDETNENKNEKRTKSIEYLKTWKKRREEWKFNKLVQVYILKNWLQDESLKDRYFRWFCDYCIGLPSKKKEDLSSEAVKLMESTTASEVIQARARQLIQSLG